MKLSETIQLLQEFKDEVGDVEFVVMTEVDGQFYVEPNRTVDIVEFPAESGLPAGPIVAVLNFDPEAVGEAND